MRGVSGNRLARGILGVVVLVAAAVGLTLAATARPAPAASSRTPAVAIAARTGGVAPGTADVAGPSGPATSVVNQGSGSPAAPGPVWCCSAATPLGLTATGQASVPGASAAARTSAIAKATADAASQARTAAQAAGVSLGQINNVEVSVPGYAYAQPMGAAANPCASSVTGAAPYSGSTPACPAGALYAHPSASTYATVTITWGIG